MNEKTIMHLRHPELVSGSLVLSKLLLNFEGILKQVQDDVKWRTL